MDLNLIEFYEDRANALRAAGFGDDEVQACIDALIRLQTAAMLAAI